MTHSRTVGRSPTNDHLPKKLCEMCGKKFGRNETLHYHQRKYHKNMGSSECRDFVDSIMPPLVAASSLQKRKRRETPKIAKQLDGDVNMAIKVACTPNGSRLDYTKLAHEYGRVPTDAERFTTSGVVLEPTRAISEYVDGLNMYRVVETPSWVGWDETSRSYALPVSKGDYVAVIHHAP